MEVISLEKSRMRLRTVGRGLSGKGVGKDLSADMACNRVFSSAVIIPGSLVGRRV